MFYLLIILFDVSGDINFLNVLLLLLSSAHFEMYEMNIFIYSNSLSFDQEVRDTITKASFESDSCMGTRIREEHNAHDDTLTTQSSAAQVMKLLQIKGLLSVVIFQKYWYLRSSFFLGGGYSIVVPREKKMK